MIKTLERECFCGSRRGEVMHTQNFALYEGHLLPRRYDVVSCLSCGFIFADTPAPQSVYDEYYANFSKYERPDAGEQLYVKRLSAERVRRLVNGDLNVKLLDVGCGAGGKLLVLKEFGFTSLYGLDPSAACAGNLRANGINAIQGSVFATDVKEKFDVITMDAVLEHIVDLNGLMSRLSGLLNPGGLLSLTVPDACRYDMIKDSAPFSAFNTEHINHFDFNSLVGLGIRHGLCVREFEDDIDGAIERNIACTYMKTGIASASAKASVAKHIEKSAAYISSVKPPWGEDIVIWGAGNHLSRLFSLNVFDGCNILGFIDNDVHKKGKSYMGSRIYAPDFLRSIDNETVIVICAENYAEEIRAQILGMGVKNRLILM